VPVLSSSGSQSPHRGGRHRHQFRPGRHEQRRYAQRFVHRGEFVLAQAISRVPNPADDQPAPIPPAIVGRQPMPGGHRDVLPARRKQAPDLPRPPSSGPGRPLAVVDGNEDRDLIKHAARPVNNIKVTRRERIERPWVDRSGRPETAISRVSHRARLCQPRTRPPAPAGPRTAVFASQSDPPSSAHSLRINFADSGQLSFPRLDCGVRT
jgi:hypothetical protein